MSLTLNNGKWLVVPNVSSDISLETANKYLDRNIVIKAMSSGTAATWTNITTSSSSNNVQLISKAGYTPTKYISALTVPASKTLDSLTLAGGTSSARTYLNTLTVNGYTTVTSLSLSGIITTITASGGYISTVNLNNTSSYIGNAYGTGYIKTNSDSTLAKYTQNGTLTTYEGSGAITTYTNTGTIATMTGSRTITNLGNSSTAGTLNITTNTYGKINIWGGKTKDKGVSIENHIVTVDGNGTAAGTAVTNSSGDLITTSLTGAGGAASIKTSSTTATGSNITIQDTDTDTGSGIYITTGGSATATRTAVTYTNTTAGWLTAHTSATTISAAANSAATNLTTNKYYVNALTIPASKTLGNTTTAGVTNNGTLYITLGKGSTTYIYDPVTAQRFAVSVDSNGATLSVA